jgi:hypothetical protein
MIGAVAKPPFFLILGTLAKQVQSQQHANYT